MIEKNISEGVKWLLGAFCVDGSITLKSVRTSNIKKEKKCEDSRKIIEHISGRRAGRAGGRTHRRRKQTDCVAIEKKHQNLRVK